MKLIKTQLFRLIGPARGVFLLGVLPCAAQSPQPASQDFHLFLLAGQSNMSGRGAIDPLNNAPHPRVSVLAKDGTWKPAIDPLHYDRGDAAVGPGKTFAETIANQNPGITIGLIPAACGGSPISVWAPGEYFSKTNSYPYDDAIARANRAMQDGTLKGILWHQGESDTTSGRAPIYEAKLRELITRFRTDLQAPNLPFYIGQLGQFGTWGPYDVTVDQAHRNIAQTMENVYFVPSSGLIHKGDDLHFDGPSARTLGQRYAASYEPPLAQSSHVWTPISAGTYHWDNASEQNNWWYSGFPNAIDSTANLNTNLGGAQTIHLNQTITLGTLNLGDPFNSAIGAGWFATTIAANGGSLVMDVASGNTVISKTTISNRSEDVIASDILLNDSLTLNCSQTDIRGWLTIIGVISGTGKSVEKTGAGLVRLAGAQLYDGGTIISAGTLQLGSGVTGGNGSVLGNIVNNATLSFNNADAQSFSALNYGGTGSFDKLGEGTLTLTDGEWAFSNLTVGRAAAGGTLAIASGSSLSVGSGAEHNLYIGSTASGNLDVSAASSFAATIANFQVGYDGTAQSTVCLGASSTITASTSVLVGYEGGSGNASHGKVTVASGGTTTIHTPLMAVGGNQKAATGDFSLLGAGATLNLEGLSSGRTELIIGQNIASGGTTVRAVTGTMDLTDGIANLKLSKLVVGQQTGTSGPYTGNGTLSLGSDASNHLDLSGAGTVVTLGYNKGTDTSLISNGTLTIGCLDATSSVTSTDNSTAILIGYEEVAAAVTNGTLSLAAGTLKITTTGAAIAGGGGNSTLNLSGGAKLVAGANSSDWIHSLTTATLGPGGVTIDTDGYNLGISQAFSGDGSFTKAGPGTLTLSGVNSYSGATNVTGGTLVIDGANTLTTGNVTVVNNARLGGNGSTPAAVTVQNGGKWLVGISDWTGTPGTGYTDFSVASLTLSGTWTLDITSCTAYANFGEANTTFPFLTATGGINGFNAANVTVVADTFPGVGTWTVARNGITLVLVYSSTSVPVDDYLNWDNHYAADLSDKAADHDGDGLSNFQEFAFGLNPTSGASCNPITGQFDPASKKFRYTRRAGSGLAYTVETSTTLQSWTSPAAATQVVLETTDGIETVEVTLTSPPAGGGVFVRVKAQ